MVTVALKSFQSSMRRLLSMLRGNGIPEIDIFTDKGFSQFQMILDSEMKRLQAAGIGITQKKAEPITFEEEEVLW